MNRHVLIAVFLAALLAVGAPAQAYNVSSSAALASDAGLEVGSEHTTDSDFENAQTLENMSVSGTGASAAVALDYDRLHDGFEDGDIAEYSGNTSDFTVQSTNAYAGSYALNGSAIDTNTEIHRTDITVGQGDQFSSRVYVDGTDNLASVLFGVQGSTESPPDSYTVRLDNRSGIQSRFRLGIWQSGTFTELANTTVKIPSNEWAKVTVSWGDNGTITATLDDASGTELDTVQTTDTTYTAGGFGYLVYSGTNTFDDFTTNEIPDTAQYISANHTVDNAEQAWLNTSLTNATANATLQGWDGSQWVDITTLGISQTSNQTASVSDAYAKYRWDATLRAVNHNGVSRWDANEGSGTTVNDKLDGNDGEFNETDWSTNAKTGSHAVYINSDNNDLLASDDYIAFKNGAKMNRSSFSWAGWVNPEANSSKSILVSNWNSSGGYHVYIGSNGQVHFEVQTEAGTTKEIVGGNLETGAYQRVYVTRTVNGPMQIRINKSVAASTTASSSPVAPSDNFFVWGINATDRTSHPYKGLIDEVALWNDTTPQAQTELLVDQPAAFNQSAAQIHDEGVLFQNDKPTVNNSAASPNDTVIQDDQATLAIPVNDSQFSASQGESVDVEFYLNGSLQDTVTMTSNGTAETTVTGLTGGEKQWHVEATDSYGDSVTSNTFTFQVPDELSVFNESDPDTLVNETGVNITARFYESGSDTVITRNTTDGTISMTGLDPTKQFIIVAKADGYHDRRIIIDSLIQQQEIYMLNKSQDSVHNRFYLDDRTGQFDSEDTKLYIERALTKDWDGDGDTQFNTVSADYFGASGGFPVDLAADQRYRLRLENDDGDTRVLGSYTADAGGDVTLQVGSSTHDLGNKTENYEWEATFKNETGPELSFKFDDDEDATEDLELVIFERGNKSNEIYNQTHAGPLGSLAVSQPLTQNQSEKTWVVDWEATRSGNTISGRRIIGKRSGPGIPLSPIWKHTASIGLLIALGGLFGGVRAEMGAVIVSMVAGVLWYIQWLPGAVTGGMVVLALSISILYQQAGGGR